MSEQTGTGTATSSAGATPAQSTKDALGKASDATRQAGAQIGSSAGDVAQEAEERTTSLAGEVKTRIASAVQDRKQNAAGRLDDVAKAMHRAGEQLEGHQDLIAHLVERGADEVGNLAATVRTNDLRGLFGKLQELAQRQPAVFVGAALAAGFAGVRLGKVAAADASRADLPHMPETFRGL